MRMHLVQCPATQVLSNRCLAITTNMLSITLVQQRLRVKVITVQLNHTTHTEPAIQVNRRHQIHRNHNQTTIKSKSSAPHPAADRCHTTLIRVSTSIYNKIFFYKNHRNFCLLGQICYFSIFSIFLYYFYS